MQSLLAVGQGNTIEIVLKVGLVLGAEMSSFALHRRLGKVPLQSTTEPANLSTLFGGVQNMATGNAALWPGVCLF